DVDEVANRFIGYAYMYDSNVGLPPARAGINVGKPTGNSLQTRLPVQPLNPNTGDVTTWAAIASLYAPGTQFPTHADVTAAWTQMQLTISWTTNIGTSGSMTLPATQAGNPSIYAPLATVTNWTEFKTFVDSLDPDRYIFRGQERS